MSGLHLQHLETFREVYQLGGYAAAAQQMNLSVPTVWQHIRGMEQAYGVRLFEKVGRNVMPTTAADRLFAAVDELLVGIDSTFDLMRAVDANDAITLVTGNRMMMEDLATPLARFRRSHPHKLVIRHGNNKRAEELLVAGEADLGFSLQPGPQQAAEGIHYEPAYFVDFLAVAPRRHTVSRTKSIGLKQLVQYPLVVTVPGTHGRDALEEALYREQLTANIVAETDNSGFTIACVQAGMGLGILAGHPDGALCSKLTIRSLRRQLGRRQIVVMWRKGRRLTDPLLDLVEAVCQRY